MSCYTCGSGGPDHYGNCNCDCHEQRELEEELAVILYPREIAIYHGDVSDNATAEKIFAWWSGVVRGGMSEHKAVEMVWICHRPEYYQERLDFCTREPKHEIQMIHNILTTEINRRRFVGEE